MNWQILDLSDIPQESGVYGFKFSDRWLYIGQSGNLRQRLTKHHTPLQIALEISNIASFSLCRRYMVAHNTICS